MKRTHKRMLGFLGLSSVAAVTVVAATMPTPGVLATASPSVTDTITVRVVGQSPDAEITAPRDGSSVTKPTQPLAVDYENINSITIYLNYIDEDGNETGNQPIYTADNLNLQPGTVTQQLSLDEGEFGYGTYVISVVGTDEHGAELPLDETSFTFAPITAEAEQDENDGTIGLRITDYGDDVESIDVYLEGELVATIPKDDFDKVTKITMGDDKESGDYAFELMPHYTDGSTGGTASEVPFDYDTTFVPHTDVPDTGRFFRDLNISKEDYLVTGLIIFFVFGIVAFGIVTRNNRKGTNRKKR